MDSNALVQTHILAATLFLLLYLIKTILIFTNQAALMKFSKVMRVPEMIISFLFLVTGVWLFVILGAIKMTQIIKLALVFASIPIAIIGFKRMKKSLAVISFLMVLGAYGLAEAGKGKPFLPKSVEVKGEGSEEMMLGVKTYGANCVMCHGEDGKKQYRHATDLSASGSSADISAVIISEGRESETGKMPAFKNVLSAEEIAAAAKYIQSLKAQ